MSTAPGRRARRTIKVALAPAWIEFAGAAQVAQLRRTTYRQIRRQTRRAGLQPIVVIDSPFPAPVALLVARLGWRYRSEIAPAAVAGAVFAAGGSAVLDYAGFEFGFMPAPADGISPGQ